MEKEFAELEAFAPDNPYVALDLEYLRDPSCTNRSFGYVVTYDTFIYPERDSSGQLPVGVAKLRSVVKLGDGGQAVGYGVGKASGSIISRTVRSYWEEGNTYNPVLQGVVIPGNDNRIGHKIAKRVGGWELRIRGDVWSAELLDRLSVEDLLVMLEVQSDNGIGVGRHEK